MSDFGQHPEQPRGDIRRQTTAEREAESSIILNAVEAGDHAETRKLLHSELLHHTEPLLSPSTHMMHELRTPLMAAAATGDLGIFSTVLRAVERAIERLRTDLREQLEILDSNGRTLVMHAVRSGNVAILKTVLDRIGRFKFIPHILKMSDDGRTILMHAARCGDQRALSTATLDCKKKITPRQMRELLEEVDGEEMTFLMHAAAGHCEGTADDVEPEMKKKQKKIKENEDISEVDEHEEIKEATSGSAATNAATASPSGDEAAAMKAAVAEASRNDPGPDATTSNAPHGGEDNQHATRKVISKSKELGKELLMFRSAWVLVKEMLWKEQVRDQLRAKDCWGRTILTYAIISGRLQVFDAAFDIVRENILDFEIEDLVGINKDDNEDTVMEASVSEASKDMQDLVNRRNQDLKKTIAIREKASTIEAKIQSFIPGKSIVIFQLLLPEMEDANAALILLIVMSALAPIFAFGSNLLTKETPSSRKNPMLSPASLLLAAPAMWLWGIGTSSIAQDRFGWSNTSSAASLAVATIVIPSLDQFFGSHKMEQVYDMSEMEWKKKQREDAKKPKDDRDLQREGTAEQDDPQRMDNQTGGGRTVRPASEEKTQTDAEGESMA